MPVNETVNETVNATTHDPAVEARVRTVLARVLDNGTTADEIGPEADLVEQYGLDSLQTITFLLAIEDEFDVELDYPQLQLDDLRSVRQFSSFVEGLTGSGSRA